MNVPLNNSNNLNRGFAFLEYTTREEAQAAIAGMNGQKFKGRTVALEMSLPRERYEHKVQNIVEHHKIDRKDAIVPKTIREERDTKKKEQDEKKEQREKLKEDKKNAYKVE